MHHQKILNNVKCCRNFEFEKRADQTLSNKIFIMEILHFKEKETVKTMSKGAIYQYILAFAGW